MHASALDSEFRDGVVRVVSETDEIIAVCLEEEFDLANAPALSEQLDHALETGMGVIVDLSRATFIDSTTIHVLLRAAKAAAARHTPVVLQMAAASTVERTAKIVGVEGIVPCVRDRKEALQIIQQQANASRPLAPQARAGLIAPTNANGHQQKGVNGSGPAAASAYPREPDAEEQHLHAVLRERARNAAQAARKTVGRSRELAWLCGEWRQQTLTKRCACCRRYGVGENWLEADQFPPIPADRTTHTICDDCSKALREAGISG